MDNIKFRALELDSPAGINWVYGYYVREDGFWMNDNIPDLDKPCVRYYIFDGHGVKYEVAEGTVGMFTDYQDKDGKDIYTTDILRVKAKYKSGYLEEVVFCRGLFEPLHEQYDYDGISYSSGDLEVVGNTVEDSELLARGYL